MKRKFVPAYLLTLVNILGFSLMLPVLPFVVERYGGSDAVYGVLLSAYAAFQFIGAPWLGRLSDSVGRKPVLMISHAGTLLSWLIFGAAWFLPDISLWMVSLPLLVIGISRVLDGITGGNAAVSQAYISDLATREEKTWVFGTVGGIVGLGCDGEDVDAAAPIEGGIVGLGFVHFVGSGTTPSSFSSTLAPTMIDGGIVGFGLPFGSPDLGSSVMLSGAWSFTPCDPKGSTQNSVTIARTCAGDGSGTHGRVAISSAAFLSNVAPKCPKEPT